MTKLAIVQKCPSNTNWERMFPEAASITVFNLCREKKDKVLVKEMDPEVRFREFNDFDSVILVGSEALKQFSKVTSITSFTGQKVPSKISSDNLYALMSPGMAAIKPEVKVELERSLESLKAQIFGNVSATYECEIKQIQDPEEALAYLQGVLEDEEQDVALDSETTGFNYLMHHLLGISITKNITSCAYIDSAALTEECIEVLQQIIFKKNVVFHNGKFDLKFFIQQLGLFFPENSVDDTMLEHYALDEREGTHGLKDLAVKYTPLGNYDLDLDLFRDEYCKKHSIKKEQFTYDLIPFPILSKYGALDSLATLMLHKKFMPLIRKSPQLNGLYEHTLKRGMRFLTRMEMNGIPVCLERLKKSQEVLRKLIYDSEAELYAMEELRRFEAAKGAPLPVS